MMREGGESGELETTLQKQGRDFIQSIFPETEDKTFDIYRTRNNVVIATDYAAATVDAKEVNEQATEIFGSVYRGLRLDTLSQNKRRVELQLAAEPTGARRVRFQDASSTVCEEQGGPLSACLMATILILVASYAIHFLFWGTKPPTT